jgi:CubicO group peptidase (beta-lactamase class C family)
MLRRRFIFAALSVCSLVAAPLKIPAQSNVFGSANPATPVAPAPLLPPEGFTDENGWTWPGTDWKLVPPESEGFSGERLDTLRSFLKTHQTDGMMIVSRGRVVFEYGDTKLVSKVASVRKSMLSLLYAVEMERGVKFDLDQTVVQLGLEDKTPFMESERHATLQQLLMSRSGIYIRSGNDEQDKLSPKRGSSDPGVRWFYNNWDFDAAGIAFEKIAHKDIFDALRDDLAVPLRFQDFDRSQQRKNYVENSTHFEYATYLSTRDMARLGLLAISHGLWGKTLWAEPGFLDYSVYPSTNFAGRNEFKAEGWTGRWGYGMLWWSWEVPMYSGNVWTGPYQGAFSAMGAGGQYITSFPSYNLVVVHKVNIDRDPHRNVSEPTYMTILGMVLDAKCDKNCT